MSNEEIHKLKQNVGKLISTNGFLSTSQSKDVALKYTDQSTTQQQNVLFEIEYDFQKIDSIIAASIAHFSQHPNEDEVLFDLDAAFKLSCVTRDDLLNVTRVVMEVTDEGSAIAQEHTNEIRKDMNSSSPVLVFGRLLTIIGEHDKAQRYFDRLLENPNGPNEEFIYYYMGLVQYHKGNYEQALQHYEHSYKIMSNDINSREFALSYVLNDIGAVFKIQGKYDKALDYFMRALEIRKNYPNYTAIATSLVNIAVIHRLKGEYDRALECSMESLRIREAYLPSEHTETAKTLNNIAEIFTDKDELKTALEYHQKSLKMMEKCLPAEHDDIASCLNRIGLVLTHQGKYNEALDYYMRALSIREQALPKEHLRMTTTLCDIGYVHYSTKNYIMALEYLEKALQIRETCFSDINDIGRVTIFTYIGLTFIKLHQYRDALTYLKRALQVGKIVYPIGHVKLTDCFINMGIAFREMGHYDTAFQYFENASKNEEQNSTKPNLISLARTYDSMGMCLCDQGDDEQGLEYRMKAVRIIEKVFPRPQYADCIDPIGHAFFTNEKYDCALECFFASLTIRVQCLPSDHIDIAQSFLLIGDVFFELEKIADWESIEQYRIKARFYYEQALAIYREKQHANTGYVLHSIGSIYENIHKYHRALEYYYQVWAWYQQYPPAEDSDREKCERSIARVKWFML
ncbi:unnamed protein product [Rotaria sordida]|uniref:ADP ribosyltransferase domain-containing protein n=1 Tax=Rotaria sordida TaxID=392033 RepID=A0A819E3S4_9BILA|nr:unnamed protein product [Rotaria sordida]